MRLDHLRDRLIAWLLIAIFATFAWLHVLIGREREAAQRAQAEAARLLYDSISATVRVRVILMNAEVATIRAAARERRR